jgi:autotransporter-associated beta strand protein
MPRSSGARVDACQVRRGETSHAAATCLIPAALATMLALVESPAAAQTANPVSVLFVGNSFTHGRYPPVLAYNAGSGNSTNSNFVHDLLCPSVTSSGACTSGAEAVAPVTPTSANTPGSTLLAQLAYLQSNPSAQYTEVGPFGGVPGVFLQFTKEAGLFYDVSLVAVSSATLTGYLGNTGSEAGDLPLITNSKFSTVIMSDQSFRPLPTTITVNGQSVPTRGSPSGFQSGMTGLVNDIDAADAAAGKPNAAIVLGETHPMASYGYTSSNPDAPIFGSSTPAQQGGNPAYAPYIGAPNPIAQMASDLHNAYLAAAGTYNAGNPTGSHVGVALLGDAWVSAINLGIAVQNPFLANNAANQVDLWDNKTLAACCTTPIGYHPSVNGAYLDALSLFYTITGVDPVTLDPETNVNNPLFPSSAAQALGISAANAQLLAIAAAETVRAGGPVSSWELQMGTIYAPLGGSAGLIKDGPGSVTLMAANTYTGGTTISSGILGGPGSVTGNVLTQTGATFAPGTTSAPGTAMGVSGNLTLQSGAFYSVGVSSTASTSANVSGTAALGGTVAVTVAPGTTPLHHYTVLQSGGLNGTTFAGISSISPPNYIPSLSYNANNVFLNVTVLSATHDFSGDSKSGILWRDATGDVGMWLMNGTTIQQSNTLGNVSTNWSFVGQRDFNGDGNSDVLWRDTAGDVGIWLMNGPTIQQTAIFNAIPSNWSIVGTGDFNGDGKADILWRDNLGNVGVWFMNGTTIQQTAALGNVSPSWVVVGADMKGDIFWRNISTGEVGMWVMNGTTVTKSMDFGAVPLTWTIAGIGDFDGNGSTDILWRDNLGNVGVWLMSGTSILSTAVLGEVPLNWNIAQTGDYNGDGKSDILWADASGDVGVWFMNGATPSSSLIYGNVGTAWTVQALNAD